MRIHRAPSEGSGTPQYSAAQLAPEVLERAVAGLSWTCTICSLTLVAFTMIHYFLQPEFVVAWAHPALQWTSASVLMLALGMLTLQRTGLLSKHQLLDLGMFFQIAVAFSIGLFEGSYFRAPDTVVVGLSSIAVWMMLCARMMPKPPVKAALAAAFCVAMWPISYAVDTQLFGYPPMRQQRMLVWILTLSIVGVWTCILNNRTLRLYIQQYRAEEVGSYALHSLIGRGGMGEVWLAKHRMLARDAALKLIRPEVLHSKSGRRENIVRKRFEREAQATASLRSPHTVALYDYGRTREGAYYYVMELIDGIDLQTLVERFGPLDPGRVAHILCQVSQSLEEAHRAGLVHRDIKPRNIILGKIGLDYDFTKVLDFGLVKSLRQGANTTATVDGTALGTPAYLPPEVALGSRSIDGRADLYSLGCTAYFLLTGKTVFRASHPSAYIVAHASTPPTPPRLRTELPIPHGLEAIVMQLLEKEPARRIPSAHELRRQLQKLRDVPEWTSERAEEWWTSHVPGLTMRTVGLPQQEATTEIVCA